MFRVLIKTCLLFYITASYFAASAQSSFFDPSFGVGGKILDTSTGTGMILQSDGKIVVNGFTFLSRYTPNGLLDGSFAVNGRYLNPWTQNFRDVALQPDGKIVAVGSLNDNKYLIKRWEVDGSLDTTFGIGGTTIIDTGVTIYRGAGKVILQPDGKIVVAGYANGKIDIVRLLPNGNADSTFGVNGIAVCDSGNVNGLQLQPDGKIIISGDRPDTGYDTKCLTARLLPDGSYDTSFNHTGMAELKIAGYSSSCTDVKVQPDGKILVAAHTLTSSIYGFAVLRYNTDGSLDSSFGYDGIAHALFSGYTCALPTAMYLKSDGKILVTGSVSGSGVEGSCLVTQLTGSGIIDSSFGQYGSIINLIGDGDLGQNIIMQPDGKILVYGFTKTPIISLGHDRPFLVRYLTTPLAVQNVSAISIDELFYPTPSSGKLLIKDKFMGHILSLDATDMEGLHYPIKLTKTASIDISNLCDGLYILQAICDDGRIAIQKIIVKSM